MKIMLLKSINLKFLKYINAVIIFFLVIGIGNVIRERTVLTINMSESLDGKVFLIIKSYGHPLEFQRNDYIAFIHPWVPGLLIKQIKGLPGDIIIHVNNKAFVNEEFIGPILTMSHDQRTLTPGTQGIIPQGSYFVTGEHERSFDSRYAEVGLLTNETIYGKAYKLF